MVGDEAKIEQGPGQTGRHDDDGLAPAGAPRREQRQVRAATRPHQEPGIGQPGTRGVTAADQVAPVRGMFRYRDGMDIHRQAPAERLDQSEALVVMPRLAVAETPHHPWLPGTAVQTDVPGGGRDQSFSV